MKRSEIASVLLVAKALDDRLTVDEARVLAWELALDPAMEFDFAKEAVGRHYSGSEKAVMPVHLNELWKAHRRSVTAGTAIAAIPKGGVPPTAVFKEAVAEIRRKNGGV